MLFVLALAALLPLALAQYGSNGGKSSSSSVLVATSTATALQTITVGQGGNLKFSPESLVVAMGSKVVFEFYPGHHSVVQGSFDKPCSPSSGLAFYSGFVDTSSGPAVSKTPYLHYLV
jgi:plastocyanin